MPSAPDNLRWGFSLRMAGDSEEVPRELHHKPVASALALWVGDAASGSRFVDHALTVKEHSAVTIEEISFLKLQTMADADFPHGRRYYTKSGYFQTLDDQVIEILLAALGEIPSMSSEIELSYLGGAAGRIGATDTAFGDRSAPFIFNILSHYCPGDDFFISRSRLMARQLSLDLRFFDLNCFSPELASGRLLGTRRRLPTMRDESWPNCFLPGRRSSST